MKDSYENLLSEFEPSPSMLRSVLVRVIGLERYISLILWWSLVECRVKFFLTRLAIIAFLGGKPR